MRSSELFSNAIYKFFSKCRLLLQVFDSDHLYIYNQYLQYLHQRIQVRLQTRIRLRISKFGSMDSSRVSIIIIDIFTFQLVFNISFFTFDYSVMQSDRNSSKTDTFHGPTTYETHVQTSFEQIIYFAKHEYTDDQEFSELR